ncbi:hypothetical protein E2C01_052787 [Portunus trituberculatus]|uniref:Uncharacterized protein n=1 Tax=Portunus trituberculatus TaxID=210409 RepID=A0A5B7GP58_PORTR|nr:hypothetical protein [Portunus trituberculatus]
MWDIIKEIITYSLFLWIFLVLSYSNSNQGRILGCNGKSECPQRHRNSTINA